MKPERTVIVDDLDESIEKYRGEGWRLEMIKPADAPREALMTAGGETVRLVSEPPALAGGQSAGNARDTDHEARSGENWPPTYAGGPDRAAAAHWLVGRAGMEYRDLIPGRLDGKLIASHIRLTKGGEVADYVHYHKVRFQMIYCLKGRIKVVYEDQGPPFWLETSDWVLQPPEIRHRVLESTAGAEVVELGIPAVHETWVEHDLKLPTVNLAPDRDFGGQRFVRHIAADSPWIATEISGLFTRDTQILLATGAFANVRVSRANVACNFPSNLNGDFSIHFVFVIAGLVTLHLPDGRRREVGCGQAITLETTSVETIEAVEAAEWLLVSLRL